MTSSYCGYAGELQYRVVNPQGAAMFDRDGSTPLGTRGIPAGTLIMGTPRGDGYTVEVASGGYLGWVHALDLQQITSAPPSPVLRTGADPTTLPPELAAALQYYQSLAQSPSTLPHPPPPHVGYGSVGDYVGDGSGIVVPVLPCPPGQHWGTTACTPDIPLPPPESPFPPTLEDWRRQHPGSTLPTPTHTGWNLFEDVLNWRDPFKGNRRGQRDLKRDQWRGRHQDQPFAQQDVNQDLFDQGQQGQGGFNQGQQGQGGFDPHHPHHGRGERGLHHDQHDQHGRGHHEEEHARQHFVGAAAAAATNAQSHAQAAQTAAAHPAAIGSAAAKHAQAASTHATLAAHHTTLASAHPRAQGAAQHARLATAHTQAAAAHAEGAHAAARGDHERSREIGHSVDRAFGGRGGGDRGPLRGFGGRRWGGGYGHPAWGREIDARWFHHHAECWRQGPYGCYVEQIFGPSGDVCYRVTPAGLQEGIELESDEQDANATYEQNTGEAAPTADDGKMPGSDQSGDGSQAPAADAGSGADSTSSADAGNDADAGSSSDTATGWYMSFSDPWGNYDYSAPGAWDSHYDYPGLGLSSTHNPYYSYPYA